MNHKSGGVCCEMLMKCVAQTKASKGFKTIVCEISQMRKKLIAHEIQEEL